MRRKPTILDQVLAEPVFMGGFIWSHGFLLCRLQENGISVPIQNSIIVKGSRVAKTEDAPDSRKLSHEDALDLYSALGNGDMATITRLLASMRSLNVDAA